MTVTRFKDYRDRKGLLMSSVNFKAKKLSEQSSEVPETLASSGVMRDVRLDSLQSAIDDNLMRWGRDIDVASAKAHNLMN